MGRKSCFPWPSFPWLKKGRNGKSASEEPPVQTFLADKQNFCVDEERDRAIPRLGGKSHDQVGNLPLEIVEENCAQSMQQSPAMPQNVVELVFAYKHREQVEYYFAKRRMWVQASVETVAGGNPPQPGYVVKISGTNRRILDVGLQNLRQPLVVAEPCELLSLRERSWTKGAVSDFYEATCEGLKVMGYEVALDSKKRKLTSATCLRRFFPPGSPVLAYHSPVRGWVGAKVAHQDDHDPNRSSWSPEEEELNLAFGAPCAGPAMSNLSRNSGFSAISEQGAPTPPRNIGEGMGPRLAEHDAPDCWTWVPIVEDAPDPGAPPYIPVPSFLVRFRADHLAHLALSGDTETMEDTNTLPVSSNTFVSF
mmetsp:Transcript_46360/g.91936  ORF Transcript_46360/g.91936 Transcript_46360/m.91936 type:complete len:365 (+) Transcript_46360:65-1159(+)